MLSHIFKVEKMQNVLRSSTQGTKEAQMQTLETTKQNNNYRELLLLSSFYNILTSFFVVVQEWKRTDFLQEPTKKEAACNYIWCWLEVAERDATEQRVYGVGGVVGVSEESKALSSSQNDKVKFLGSLE